jgi:hypothetical protein
MNTTNEEAIERALRKHVERAVRPVWAAESRKLRMREELLAHLTAIYEGELEQRGGADEALAAACERFGSPAELTAELNWSIGAFERWSVAVDQWLLQLLRAGLQFRAGEPHWRGALRILAWLAAFNFAIFMMVPVISLLTHGWPDDPTTFTLLPKVVALLLAAQWIAVVAAQEIERTLHRQEGWRVWMRLGGQSLAWSLTLVLLAAFFWVSVSREFFAASVFVNVAASVFCIVPPLMISAAWFVKQDQRRRRAHEAWTLLPLDD